MAVNSVNNNHANANSVYNSHSYAARQAEERGKSKSKKDPAEDTGVVYEKDSASKEASKTTNNKVDTELIAKLKADSNNRISQLQGIVQKMMQGQGSAVGKADSMWRFLAKGDFTVDAATQSQAQADIADDGYWGVDQTSDRILDFAKALSGSDPSKADKLIDAFKKGFAQATKAWGGNLPDISQKTYDAVMTKFDTWKNGETA